MSRAISLSNFLSDGRFSLAYNLKFSSSFLYSFLSSSFFIFLFIYHALIHTQKCIQRTCFECLLLVLFQLCVVFFFLHSVCLVGVYRCSFWILHLRLMFTGSRSQDHFTLFHPKEHPILSCAQSRALFICFALFVYLYLCT